MDTTITPTAQVDASPPMTAYRAGKRRAFELQAIISTLDVGLQMSDAAHAAVENLS